MLKNKLGLSFGWASALAGAVVLFVPACGGSDTTSGGGECTANQQTECACPGGKKGVQVCNSDGRSFGLCQCESTGSGGSTGSNSGSGGAGAGVGGGACGDGIEDQGECDVGAENFCLEDCPTTGSGGGTTGSGGDPCKGVVTYAGLVPGAGSAWGAHPQSNGKTGYEAGIEICKTLGADHPCTYVEVKKAEAAGELANIAMGTTAWIHRTTPEMVDGVMSDPTAVDGAGNEVYHGGTCNNWVYITNHISDGEYASFEAVGVPTYHLDSDMYFDGVDTTHAQPGLNCGGETRGILCCFPACAP